MKTARRTTPDHFDDVDRRLDEALEETFPASDPVACTTMPSIRPSAVRSHKARAERPARSLATICEPVTGARS
ncbi:hypothetical protein LMG9964_06195 [Paraburkholderia phenoliruptrix]|uniref:Uncharacterized protein n=1 Tax=Paraburkholderia phenoliruptrix TaxID=252970 RepID=A0A6J5KHT3_9BURK|nr:hypothetical protein LMG9964_06195 [Paraburkholderia phenoliruptrix]